MLIERQNPGSASEEHKTQDAELGGRSEAMKHEARREGAEASRTGSLSERACVRDDLGARYRSELVGGTGGGRQGFKGGAGAAADTYVGESARTSLYLRFEDRSRPSTRAVEDGGNYRPYHLSVPPSVFKVSSCY